MTSFGLQLVPHPIHYGRYALAGADRLANGGIDYYTNRTGAIVSYGDDWSEEAKAVLEGKVFV